MTGMPTMAAPSPLSATLSLTRNWRRETVICGYSARSAVSAAPAPVSVLSVLSVLMSYFSYPPGQSHREQDETHARNDNRRHQTPRQKRDAQRHHHRPVGRPGQLLRQRPAPPLLGGRGSGIGDRGSGIRR